MTEEAQYDADGLFESVDILEGPLTKKQIAVRYLRFESVDILEGPLTHCP